jgi:hypothetical protein
MFLRRGSLTLCGIVGRPGSSERSNGSLYLLAQAWYLRVVRQLPGVRLAGAGALILGGRSLTLMPPYAACR